MVKVKNKNKKIVYASIIFITILFAVLLIGSQQVKETTIINNDPVLGQVTITIHEYYGLGKVVYFFKELFGLPLTIIISPSVVEPGAAYTVTFAGGIPTSCSPKGGFFYIKDNTWSIIAYKSYLTWGGLPAAGASTTVKSSFNAPMIEGTYTALFSLYNQPVSTPEGASAQYICFSEFKDFTVKQTIVDCPADSCDNWVFLTNANRGSIYERWCHHYGSPPSCTDNPSYESKIVCDPGYKLSNGNCVAEAYCGDNVCGGGETCNTCSHDCGTCAGTTVPCYYCDASGKVASIQSATCGAGFSTSPDITCTITGCSAGTIKCNDGSCKATCPECPVGTIKCNDGTCKTSCPTGLIDCFYCDRTQGIIRSVKLAKCEGEYYNSESQVGTCQKIDACTNIQFSVDPNTFCTCNPGDDLCKPSVSKPWYEQYWYLLAGGALLLILGYMYYIKGGRKR